jgi:DNA polymerase III delta prime subunit
MQWTDVYRPTKLEDYVGDSDFKKKLEEQIKIQEIYNATWYGGAGTGKSTAVKILTSLIDTELLVIEGSRMGGIDTIREKIEPFVQSVGFSKYKLVWIDEASGLSPQAQSALLVMIEKYSDKARFILTCNWLDAFKPPPDGKMHPLLSRCPPFKVEPPNILDVGKYCFRILDTENIKYEATDVVKVVKEFYPDIRSIVNNLQLNSLTNKQLTLVNTVSKNSVYKAIVEVLCAENDKKNAFVEIRQLLANSGQKSFDGIYTYLYEKLDLYAKTNQFIFIKHIAEAQASDSQVPNKEINVINMLGNIINDLKN